MCPAPEVIQVTPPAALLTETPVPPFVGATNADLAGYVDELLGAVAQCNADKAAVRSWAD